MPRIGLLLALGSALLASVGCASPAEREGWTCAVPGDLADGELRATVGDEAWTASTTTWMMAGSSLQLNTEAESGWRLTLVGQATVDGGAVDDALAAGIVPITIPVESGEEGGWAILYPDDGDSYATASGGGGELVVVDLAEDRLTACFGFPVSDGTTELEVTGALAAVPAGR